MKTQTTFKLVLAIALLGLAAFALTPARAAASSQGGQPENSIQANSPQVAVLIAFSAKATKSHTVRVSWETGAEFTLVGFHVYRKTKNSDWVKMTNSMISPDVAGGITGSTYSFVDKKVREGKLYSYRLELVSSAGNSEWSDIVTVKAK